MIDLDSAEYYHARELRERELARVAATPAAASIHLDLARRYSKLTLQPETSMKLHQ